MRSVHRARNPAGPPVMVVVMRVVENCDHEPHSVLQKGVKAQF
jgi:hypothetical protein